MPPRRVDSQHMVASGALAFLHSALALAYSFPPLATGANTRFIGRRVSVVTYIESLGPVWQTGFGVTALALVVGLAAPRWLATAHTFAAATMAVFATALWLGFAFSEPRPAILAASGFTATVVWHLTVGVAHSRLHAAPQHRHQVRH